MRLIVDLDFGDRRQVVDGDGEWQEWFLRALSLLGSHHILANGQLGEFGAPVHDYLHSSVFTIAQ